MPNDQRVPEGWKMVPVEPDETMIDAGRECREYISEETARTVWCLMLDSTPPAPSPDRLVALESALRLALQTMEADWREIDYEKGDGDRDLEGAIARGDEGTEQIRMIRKLLATPADGGEGGKA